MCNFVSWYMNIGSGMNFYFIRYLWNDVFAFYSLAYREIQKKYHYFMKKGLYFAESRAKIAM